MKQINIQQRQIGVNFIEGNKAEVLLWAPLAEKADLLIENTRVVPLIKEEQGYWKLITDQLGADERYQFRINKKVLPDPASLSQPEGVHGVSEAIDIKDFSWTDGQWNNHNLEDYLIYELHTGTFSFDGTFDGIKQKLGHLKKLGINTIEIMPVAQFPGSRNWGYDGVFPFAVQNSYGGVNGLKKLVSACHEMGLAVILDVVYNHLGPEGNYFSQFAPYFTEKYNTPWGSAINFDDAWCDGVRHYFIENVLMWFRDFHIDALRLDAVHAIKDLSPNHILKEIKQNVNRLMEETGRKHYLIAELDLNDTRFINPLEKNGYGMDAQWVDEFHHALRVTSGGERSGYYSDFEGISHLAKSYKDAYVYDGVYSPHRFKTFGTKTEENPGHQFIVFSQNHDQMGNRMLGERSSELVSFEMQKLMAGAILVSPYLPMLFMGEEWGETNPFLYFVSHTDPDLVEAVRKGRKKEFLAFHAQGEAPDPQAEETFLKSKLQWDLLTRERHQVMFNYYQNLIAIRKKYPALHKLNRKQLETTHNEDLQTLMLHRWHENNHVYCLMNFSKDDQPVELPVDASQLKKIFDSADQKWNGPASGLAVADRSSMYINPETIRIYINANI